MKRLIIHIGYPKTATTTLQLNVFAELAKRKDFEYLSHTDNASDLGFVPYPRTFNFIMGNGLFEDCEQELLTISRLSTPLMLISNESFAHVSKNYPTADKKRGVLENLGKLQKVFSPIFDHIDILMTIRNQQMMITSYYTQEYYNIIHVNSGLNHPDKWVSSNFGEQINEDELLFNYEATFNSSEELFGIGHTHVLLYEDLLKNSTRYFNKLASVIDFNPEMIQGLFEKTAQNTTVKSKDGKTKTDAPSMHIILNQWAKRIGLSTEFRRTIKKLVPSFLLGYKVNKQVEIDILSEQWLSFIQSRFDESNIKLCEKVSYDDKTFIDYNYIKREKIGDKV